VLRTITGFHRDEHGDWVAELSCHHRQHVRHRPPFQDRPWTQTAGGRAGRIGTPLDCPLCDRAELPGGLTTVRTLGPFDAGDLPAGLRSAHRLPDGTWGLVRVLDGSVGLAVETDPPILARVGAGGSHPLPPGVDHRLVVDGPVRLAVDLLRA
jgi:tellurite methyltransferase